VPIQLNIVNIPKIRLAKIILFIKLCFNLLSGILKKIKFS
jgi:hypothetical protein